MKPRLFHPPEHIALLARMLHQQSHPSLSSELHNKAISSPTRFGHFSRRDGLSTSRLHKVSNFPTTFAEKIKFLWGRNRIIFPW